MTVGGAVVVIGVAAAVSAAVLAGATASRAATPSSAEEACPGADALRPAAQHSATLRCLVNWVRKLHGRKPVAPSPALERAARRKASDVIRCASFSHRPCGKAASAGARAAGYRIRSWGEDLYAAEGSAGTPLAALGAWLASPRHRAIVLQPGFAHLGVAVVADARVAGMQDARLAVLQLASPL